jgi:hypothetical protein
MKKLLIASAIAIAASTGAYAQTSTPNAATPDATSPQTTGSIPNARMEVIRNYWQTERPAAVVLPSGVVISRGAVVPSGVELRTFPQNVGMTEYRYVVVGNTMYLVNPSDRRVVQVVE